MILQLLLAWLVATVIGLLLTAGIFAIGDAIGSRRQTRRRERSRGHRLCWDIPGLTREDREWLHRWSFRLTDPTLPKIIPVLDGDKGDPQ